MSHKSLIRLISVLIVALVTSFGFTTTAHAGPHYVKGPTASVDGNSLVITFKASGLGNTVTSADFSLTGTVTVTAQCFTKSGNPVQGVPKTETNNVNTTLTFPVRNGQVTGMFVVAPLSTLKCTGKQVVRILEVSYNLVLSGDNLPDVYLSA
ncbi:hypothetical protein [Tessaracoccus sp. Z1128]